MSEPNEKKKKHVNTVNVATLNKALKTLTTEFEEYKAKNESILSILVERVTDMQDHILVLETPKKVKTIQKPEEHMGEHAVTPRATPKHEMNTKYQIESMVNLIQVLPPNMVDENNRQHLVNVQAICGFQISEDMMDQAYAQMGE